MSKRKKGKKTKTPVTTLQNRSFMEGRNAYRQNPYVIKEQIASQFVVPRVDTAKWEELVEVFLEHAEKKRTLSEYFAFGDVWVEFLSEALSEIQVYNSYLRSFEESYKMPVTPLHAAFLMTSFKEFNTYVEEQRAREEEVPHHLVEMVSLYSTKLWYGCGVDKVFPKVNGMVSSFVAEFQAKTNADRPQIQ